MSFHPVMPYGTEQWHRSRRVTLPEGPEFSYTAENRQRFEEAQRWFHTIFDPTTGSKDPAPARFWKLRPFYEAMQANSIETLHQELAPAGVQVTVAMPGFFRTRLMEHARAPAYLRAAAGRLMDRSDMAADAVAGEILALRLLSLHNTYFYAELVRQAREAIVLGRFEHWRSSALSRARSV